VDDPTNLELIDLGDVKEVTKGLRNQLDAEDHGDFPRNRIE
jgi:hypothetical protein